MDSSRGKPQHSHRGYKSTFPHNFHHENNSYNLPSAHGIFKTSRIQRHSLKWRKDHFSRGSYRTRFPYRKNDFSGRKSNKSAEDMEEEERKKKLTDTANKLLSKIKTWTAEKNHSEDESQQNVNQGVSENSCKPTEEKSNSEGKPKRIAHSKKAKLVKNRTPKSFSQPSKTVARYDVNKETVKDFQNRIQHKLIEEIMQMPKENLQNVLNDPKINPIMEVKMSRLVRENKLLIAQKLRALAESKMKSSGSSTNPQLLVDIDKLIDPVIETDLSVLPFELIKQMENVFQVQFDYSPNADSQEEIGVSDSAADNIFTIENEMTMDISSGTEENVKMETNEDLSLYECSTDEDEDIDSSKSLQNFTAGILEEITYDGMGVNELPKTTADWKNKKRKHSTGLEVIESSDNISVDRVVKCSSVENVVQENDLPVSVECVPEEAAKKSSSPESTSVSCQTDGNSENASTQTPEAVESLYGVPLPKEATDESASSLLEEVNSIQNLTNKLNERRFMIFLKLAKMNPSGSFTNEETTKRNFMETLANGNLQLVESLKQFFNRPQSYGFSGKKKRKPPERNNNRSRK